MPSSRGPSNPGIEPASLMFSVLAGRLLPLALPGKPNMGMRKYQTSTLEKKNATVLNSSLKIKISQIEWKENTNILDTHSFCCVYLPCSLDCAVIIYQLLGHYTMSSGTLECTVKVLVAQSWPILCNPMDCSLPVSTVHGILQARIPEWIAIPFSRRSSWHRDQTWVSHIAGRFFTVWATREALECSIFQ